MHLQTQFQFNRLDITKVYDALHDIYLWFVDRASFYKQNQPKHSVLCAVRDKLKKYVLDGGQPAMPLYREALLFNPFFLIP